MRFDVGRWRTRRPVLLGALLVGMLAGGPPPLRADPPRPGVRAAASFDPYFLWMGGHVQTGRAAGFSARLLLEVGLGEGFALGGGGEVLWYTPVTRRRLTPYTGIESFALVAVGGTAPSAKDSPVRQGTSSLYTIGGPGAIVGVQHDIGRFVDVRVSLIRHAPAVRVAFGRTWGDTGGKLAR